MKRESRKVQLKIILTINIFILSLLFVFADTKKASAAETSISDYIQENFTNVPAEVYTLIANYPDARWIVYKSPPLNPDYIYLYFTGYDDGYPPLDFPFIEYYNGVYRTKPYYYYVTHEKNGQAYKFDLTGKFTSKTAGGKVNLINADNDNPETIAAIDWSFIDYSTHDLVFNTVTIYEKQERISIPMQYLQWNWNKLRPYYLYIQTPNGNRFFICSDKPFYLNNDGNIHRSGDTVSFKYAPGEIQGTDWKQEGWNGTYTRIKDGIKQEDVIYNSYNILDTEVTDNNIDTNNVVAYSSETVQINMNPIPGLNTILYSYRYDTGIPTLSNIVFQNKAWIREGKLVIAPSEIKYEVLWTRSETDNYELEIFYKCKSRKTNEVIMFPFQTYARTYNEKYIHDSDEKFIFDKHISKKIVKMYFPEHEWYNIDITDIYIRYFKIDSENMYVNHGLWKRITPKYSTGDYITTTYDVADVEITENINPETGQVEYIDIVQDGTLIQDNYSLNGGLFDPAKVNDVVLFNMDEHLSNATKTISEFGQWVGQVPQFLGSLFQFLPIEIITFIGLAITLIIIARFLGR